MDMSPEQLARLPSWADYDPIEGVIRLDPTVIYPLYLHKLGWEKTKYSMTIIRRIIEEQLIRAVLKARVIRYHADGAIALSEPMWMEDARFAMAEYLPASDVGTQYVTDMFVHIRILFHPDWDIRNALSQGEDDEVTAQSAWHKYFFPLPL